ncbi:MAG TPA: FHA domain-containing protein, partial [Polyangiaceae bacterium]|nr:FHA domain-containing protein [Polyangiaceae bacterium]
MRFCVTCGQLLVDAVEGGASRLGSIDLSRTVAASPKPGGAVLRPLGDVAPSIEPARVIEVGSTVSPQGQRTCPRCKGARDAGAQFCRFCGLPFMPAPPSAAAQDLLAPSARPNAAAAPARVVLITRDGSEGPSYPLGVTTDIGRTEGSILFADDPFVSPRHARIVARGGEFFVRDLESTNGVFVRIPFAAP